MKFLNKINTNDFLRVICINSFKGGKIMDKNLTVAPESESTESINNLPLLGNKIT